MNKEDILEVLERYIRVLRGARSGHDGFGVDEKTCKRLAKLGLIGVDEYGDPECDILSDSYYDVECIGFTLAVLEKIKEEVEKL